MTEDFSGTPEDEAGQALKTLASISGDILVIAYDPTTRHWLDAKEIGKAIDRLQDALVLMQMEQAA